MLLDHQWLKYLPTNVPVIVIVPDDEPVCMTSSPIVNVPVATAAIKPNGTETVFPATVGATATIQPLVAVMFV